MKSLIITIFFTIGCLSVFANENSNSNYPEPKRKPLANALIAPLIDYTNGFLSIETTSSVNKISVTIVDESGSTVYRRTTQQALSTNDFFVSLNPGKVYTIITTIDGIQHFDIIEF